MNKLAFGAIIGAVTAVTAFVGTNVVIKTMAKTGGSISGLGYLALGEVVRPLRFAIRPFTADIK